MPDLFSSVQFPDPAECISPTFSFNADHPSVKTCVASLGLNGHGDRERAIRVFEFVRDKIQYEFFPRFAREDFQSSQVLSDGKGFCTRKASLLCGLSRAAGVPSAIVFADLRDHSLPERYVEVMGSNVLPWHGIGAFYVGGKWVVADATISPDLVERKGYREVQFDGTCNALLPEKRLDGRPHIEYSNPHGAFSDLPYETVLQKMLAFSQNVDVQTFREFVANGGNNGY